MKISVIFSLSNTTPFSLLLVISHFHFLTSLNCVLEEQRWSGERVVSEDKCQFSSGSRVKGGRRVQMIFIVFVFYQFGFCPSPSSPCDIFSFVHPNILLLRDMALMGLCKKCIIFIKGLWCRDLSIMLQLKPIAGLLLILRFNSFVSDLFVCAALCALLR